MNIVLDDAAEVNVKTSVRKPLGIYLFICIIRNLTTVVGRILLKGDCITLIQRLVQKIEE
jgi:small nuclear ribonucleoprotein (snRNP)-like protein